MAMAVRNGAWADEEAFKKLMKDYGK